MLNLLGPYGFPVFVVALWAIISLVVSLWGGWRTLASVYRSNERATGEQFRFQSARLRGGMNYNNCLTVSVDPRGIYLSVFFPFRLGHPLLFFPWEDVRVEALPSRWFPRAKLLFSRCPGVPVVVTQRLANRILHTGGRQGLQFAGLTGC